MEDERSTRRRLGRTCQRALANERSDKSRVCRGFGMRHAMLEPVTNPRACRSAHDPVA
jgi:hypothetical protein